jgi:predicted nucleic acid-binding protein
MFETAFTLERSYKYPKAQVREAMLALLDQPNLRITGRARWRRVFNLYADHNIPLGDAMNVEFMARNRLTEIVSFDRDFDRIPGVTRIEP